MDLTSCYSDLKASLEALSKENITDLSYLHDRIMVKLQIFMYTNKLDMDDHSKLLITLSSEIENLETSDSIAKSKGLTSLTISGMALMFTLVALIEIGINAMLIYTIFCGVLVFLLCMLEITSTAQQSDTRKKIIYKMCLEILDKESEKLDTIYLV